MTAVTQINASVVFNVCLQVIQQTQTEPAHFIGYTQSKTPALYVLN